MSPAHTSKFNDAASERVVESKIINTKKVQVYAQKINQGETDEAIRRSHSQRPLQSTTSSDFLGFDKRYQPRPLRAATVPAKTA